MRVYREVTVAYSLRRNNLFEYSLCNKELNFTKNHWD